MNLRKILPLVLIAGAAAGLQTGCASHTASHRTHTVLLGGLLEVEEGAFDRPHPYSAQFNPDEPLPGAKLNGNKISLLWGLVSYHNQ